jgi:DNA-binding IclR family transcriptional regulator
VPTLPQDHHHTTEGEAAMNIIRTVRVFKILMEASLSQKELARRADWCPKSVGRLLKEMKEQKLIYVIDYTNETDGRNRVKIYALGDGVDAVPRRTQSQEARSRRSYLRKVAEQKRANVKTTFVGSKGLWQ